ncbi:Large subunit GTPase 1 [Escovopsis weberi]|uniref:Large subunit GTPase 1 n=1 Tax=Escovopsis weberi TaxID=150374 RepID=A0A0M8N3Y9_ESCWE|nr:Large subunit GTPase 1 [Escovopsis weberi]
MVLAKSKKNVGLGNTLMNDRFGKGKGSDHRRTSAVTRTNRVTGESYLVNDKKDAAWVKMRSVTEQGALDEFLATAELAGTDFTAEKMNNVKIIHTDQKNPYLLSANEERDVLGRHRMHKNRLTVPRRPKWDATTTPQELDVREREALLNWRRGLAELQENNDLLMTPFERNIEVWRQLWRVIERSDLIVQIVDARNPLLFRSEDLESYVKAVDPRKENLLLINKADMMTMPQRTAWAKHLKEAGIKYKFFSAHLAKEALEEGSEDEEEEDDDVEEDEEEKEQEEQEPVASSSKASGKQPAVEGEVSDEAEDQQDDSEEIDTEILTVQELEAIFLKHSPAGEGAEQGRKLQVGLVGYPNVGKSSTINALIGSKKVSVSSTPGKTKHFQTIHLSDRVVLCDCPGLVFPNFATTKADLVTNGVLPIDQMREHTGPVSLVTQRIPQRFLEAIYGIKIDVRPLEEGGTGVPTSEELLRAYATARGFQTQGLGQPDESRASRYILKDYVNGKLLFVHPPPGVEDARAFNAELYDEAHLPERRRAALVAATEALALDNPGDSDVELDEGADRLFDVASAPVAMPGAKSRKLDKNFFTPKNIQGHVSRPFNYKYTEQGSVASEGGARILSGRKARTAVALENGLDPKDVQVGSSKKHFKGNSRDGKGRKTRRAVNLED